MVRSLAPLRVEVTGPTPWWSPPPSVAVEDRPAWLAAMREAEAVGGVLDLPVPVPIEAATSDRGGNFGSGRLRRTFGYTEQDYANAALGRS